MKKKFIYILISFIAFVVIIFSYRQLYNSKIKTSILYTKINEYKNDLDLSKLTDISQFEKDSKEFYFFKGLGEYYNENIEEAYELLKKSEMQYDKNDLVYEIYLQYFLNECEIFLKGKGNPKKVKFLIENIGKLSVFKNETDFIWDSLSSIIEDENSREEAILYIEKYIKETNNLEKETILKLKGFIAIFKMMNKDYIESSHLFHEIIMKSEEVKNKTKSERIKLKSYEYLGNMNFILENYEDAIDIYDTVIKIPIENPQKNASTKYGAYINKTTAYIEMKEYEKARKSFEETQKIISFISKERKDEIEIFSYNNLARIEIYEENFDKAREILKKCDSLVKKSSNKSFFYAELHKNISYCELYIKEKKYKKALELLDKLLEEDKKNEAGFESEIYFLKMEIYKNTNNIKKYIETHTKLDNLKQDTELMLKKNYIKFLRKSFEAKKLEEQKRKANVKIKILFGFIGIAFIAILYQIIKVKNLKSKNLIDQLTEVYNRKYLEFLCEKLEKRKEKEFYNILMIDIDYFKKYNDTYGHIKGDYVIRSVAQILKNSVEKNGSVIRYGGEEFLVISKFDEENYLKKLYERIFKKLEEKNIVHETSEVSNRITLSVGGIKGKIENKKDFYELIKKADLALYEAKETGRNRLIVKKL